MIFIIDIAIFTKQSVDVILFIILVMLLAWFLEQFALQVILHSYNVCFILAESLQTIGDQTNFISL